MSLLARTTARRRQGNFRASREQIERVNLRTDEIASVAEIESDYEHIDRRGDLVIESRFQELYQLVDTEEERAAVARAFAVWQKSEQAEDRTVRGSVGGAVTQLKDNNDYWLHDGCGPSGRSA